MEDLIKIIDEKIETSINEFTKRRSRMHKIVRWFKYPLVCLTAISTIVLGLDLGSELVIAQKKYCFNNWSNHNRLNYSYDILEC